MKSLVALFLFFSVALLAKDGEYILVDEFFSMYPEQKVKHENFKQILQDPPVKIDFAQKKPIKITIVYPGNQIADYWRKSKISFEKRLQELGVKYELTDYFTKPNTEIREQARQILKAIKDGTDYLVFTLEASKHKKLIEQILRHKKPKLILQNITTPLRDWSEIEPFFYVGFDHVEGSIMIADYFLEKKGPNSTYGVLFYTEDGYISQMRGGTFVNYMDKKCDYELLDSFYTNADFDRTYRATKALLEEHPDIDFIYACSTDIAFGALKAIKELKREDVSINGWGGGAKELEAIKNGDLDVTVMRINDDNGVAMAEAIKLDIEGKGDRIPKIFSGEIKLIHKNNIKSSEALIDRAFRYSGK